MKLASFDIFDTTLIRKCGQPENIFYLLAHKLFPNDEIQRERFITWRKNIESQVSRKINYRETKLTDIYTKETITEFNDYSIEKLIQTEKQVEYDNLVANPEIKSKIEQLRNEDFTICFISDMYLDSKFLSEVLRKESCLLNDEKVYVSCEEGGRKSTGVLFDKIRRRLNPQEWEHYGDNPISDIKKAKEKGITAHAVVTGYTQNEKYLAKNRENSYNIACLAGLQRTARILLGNNTYTTFAADFVAPAYIPYVNYVMRKAKEHNIKRLYFLSRDSYILQKIAEQQKAVYPDIEIRYLFVSRKALLLPYLNDASPEKFIAIQDKQTLIGKRVDSLLESLGTNRKELKEDYNISFEFNKIYKKDEENEFIEKIFGSKSLYKPRLTKLIEEKRTILTEYFSQEGLFDGTRNGMVDVGWLGTTRLMINSFLKEQGCGKTTFFYYGTRNDMLPQKYGNFFSFFTPKELDTELTTLIENYFSASPYPTTIGYARENGKIVPLFKVGENFCDNNITRNNIAVAEYIAKEISAMPVSLSNGKQWSIAALEDIRTMRHKDINLTPLCTACNFDDTDFVRKLSIKKLAKIAFVGARCTAFDKASVRISVALSLFPIVWNMHKFSSKIRRFLYSRFIKQ